jgi:hypothetical protein
LILSLVQHESSKVAGGSRKIFRDTIAFPIWSFMTCPHAKCDASPHWIVKFRYLFSNKMDAILPFLFFNGTEGWTKNIIVWFTTFRIPTYTKKNATAFYSESMLFVCSEDANYWLSENCCYL